MSAPQQPATDTVSVNYTDRETRAVAIHEAGHAAAAHVYRPSIESSRAGSLFGRNGADVVVLFHSTTHTVADPDYRQAVAGYLAALPASAVTSATSYWTSGQPNLVSADRHSTYAVLQLAGGSDQGRENTYKAIKADFPAVAGPPAGQRMAPRHACRVAWARAAPLLS